MTNAPHAWKVDENHWFWCERCGYREYLFLEPVAPLCFEAKVRSFPPGAWHETHDAEAVPDRLRRCPPVASSTAR